MTLTNGAKTSSLEGVVRSVSKEVYGKGPVHVRGVCHENVFLIRCKGVLSAIELGLAKQGFEGIRTLKRIRCELFETEQTLIREQFERADVKVEAILQDLRPEKDERLLVVVTEENSY